MVKIIYIEQVADVIAHKCSLWYQDSKGSFVEVGYTHVLDLTIRDILSMISQNNLYYNKTK